MVESLSPIPTPAPPLDLATGALEQVAQPSTPLGILHGMIGVLFVSFLTTLLVTPLMRRLAVSNGIIDVPSDPRKVHKIPVAYLGGVAVWLGVMLGIGFSYLAPDISLKLPFDMFETQQSRYDQVQVPSSILIGMFIIMFTGMIDDVWHLSPRLKIGGQLIAAAALAMQDVGTKVAAAILQPIGGLFGNSTLTYQIPLPMEFPFGIGTEVHLDLIYWAGVVIIALFVLGACNASNLIDGLDGLCSGVTAIAAAALLVVALVLASVDDGRLDSARVVLALALLGATLGFLPHNLNPATIFLGDAGSLLLGYLTITIVLSLGDTGRTQLVVAGLIIYAIPIIDTTLAMVRRKLAGRSMSDADDQHLHHMLKGALGVKGAVFALYGIATVFAALGIWLTFGRVRVVMTVAFIVGAYVGVIAIKVARRQLAEETAAQRSAPVAPAAPGSPEPPAPPAPGPKRPESSPEPT